jgi:hypothetical protein
MFMPCDTSINTSLHRCDDVETTLRRGSETGLLRQTIASTMSATASSVQVTINAGPA